MVTRELTRSIHGPIATRRHSMLLLAVRREVRLVLMGGTSCGSSTHVTWVVVVMMRDLITWSKIKLWRCHARWTGTGWPVHTLMMHMIGV